MSGDDVQATDVVRDDGPVPAYPKWEWDCPACESTVLSEFPPPSEDECDVCGHKVRTDQR